MFLLYMPDAFTVFAWWAAYVYCCVSCTSLSTFCWTWFLFVLLVAWPWVESSRWLGFDLVPCPFFLACLHIWLHLSMNLHLSSCTWVVSCTKPYDACMFIHVHAFLGHVMLLAVLSTTLCTWLLLCAFLPELLLAVFHTVLYPCVAFMFGLCTCEQLTCAFTGCPCKYLVPVRKKYEKKQPKYLRQII